LLPQNAKSKILNQVKFIDTLAAFFDCDLNLSTASEKLNISRNTLTNRLNKIKESTGLDPKKFSDAVKLKLLILINQLGGRN